ncbi:nudix hydrolase 15, mitochondrial-like [Phalaenopsis equestris]|uniref:nudix hydrolase 15, mitochondrial-like n=1 Tax=Phalaenopsis equestris TaxID=78828 RepID=UPI0009E4A596|nr:nudix hydrolase 15, mitochondrial-like [Phalaenopsis equestris]
MTPPTNPTRRLHALIHQFGHHNPKSRQLSGEPSAKDDECKAFSLSERFHSKRAAVLVCLFEGAKGDIRVILTKRSSKLSTHSGEVSLPGGMVEAGDAGYRETAVREAKEEIGLDPSLVAVVAILQPFLSQVRLPVADVPFCENWI